MEVLTDGVLKVLTYCTSSLGLPTPDVDSLELGDENELVAPELGGDVLTYPDFDGTIRRFSESALQNDHTGSDA